MKTKFFLVILVLVINSLVSFGQKITNINFKGCLGNTVFNQWSAKDNTDISLAFAGWVSAVAAPTVDVANISDMVITFDSYSTASGKLEIAPLPAIPLPTDFSNAAQPSKNAPWVYSQTYEKSGKNLSDKPTSPASWRKNQIFINPLTIASLPIIVNSTAKLQAGYSFCGELSGNKYLQLHTNGQAAFLAFNAAATTLKFQLENVGSADEAAGATIAVEKSADLNTWSLLKNIDISNQSQSVQGSQKQDYSISINDATARYVRIKISGIAKSRASKKMNINQLSIN